MRVFEDNSFSIGNTPLVKINRICGRNATVLAKIEGRNPAYSVKCRIGSSMIMAAEREGLLKPGMEVIEPTSGNTGIGLAFVGAARGYKVTLVMPESMSVERRRILKAFGANVVLSESARGMTGAIELAEEITVVHAGRYYMPQQFCNPANPAIHEQTTGPEIWDDTDGTVDVLVAGVGTGGTITGISRYIKNSRKKDLITVAVEPESSPVITQRLAGQRLSPGSHSIQGIGAGFIPANLDLQLLDRVEQVSDKEAFEFARRLATEEGIFSGISSGAAMAAAARLAELNEFRGKTFVVILPDAGERYLSTDLFLD